MPSSASVPSNNNVAAWMEVTSTYACRMDAFGRIIEIGSRLSSFLGIESFPRDETTFCSLIGQNEETSFIGAAFKVGKADMLRGVLNTVVPHVSGKMRNVRWILSPFETDDGAPGYVAMGWPEEDWPRMERQMINMGRIVEMIVEALAIISARGFVEYVNPAFCTVTGYKAQEVIGRPVSALVSVPEDISVMQQALECFRRGDIWEGKLKMRRKDGAAVFISVRVQPVEDLPGGNKRYIVVAADLSLQHNLERRVEELQRLESMGTLSSGIAHRFNNILASVSGQAELLLMSSKDPAVKQRAQRVLDSVLRGKEVVAQLTLFGRRAESRTRLSDLVPVVRNAVKFIRAAQPRCVTIEEDLPEKTSEVMANTGEIHQVMINLLTNALEAVGSKQGQIRVRVYEDDFSLAPDGRRARCVALEVHDTGIGIDPAIRHRIFEPFFTTHGFANSSGMGLAVTYGIIHRHGGEVSFESEPGKGTTFLVTIPVRSAGIDAESPVGEEKLRGRILFADEEGFSMESGKRVLEDLGYEVTAVSSVEEIKKSLRDLSRHFDLFITNLHTGGQNAGLGLCRVSRKEKPGMPVLLCLGIREVFEEKTAVEAGASAILRLPVSREQLGDVVGNLVPEVR